MAALFVIIGVILFLAWKGWYRLGLAFFCLELFFVLLMFWHHATDHLSLNF